ncbi:RAD51D (predicted) [Pycnogonum litorale]
MSSSARSLIFYSASYPALTDEIIYNLKQHGVNSGNDFLAKDIEDLLKLTALTFQDVVSIKKLILSQLSTFPVNANSVREACIKNSLKSSTGSATIDLLLDGGIVSGELIEVVGSSASGKTQFCLGTSLSMLQKKNANVLYLDTNCGFSSQRLMSMMCERSSGNQAQQLERIRCVNVHCIFKMMQVLGVFRNHLKEQTDAFYSNTKLLVIDSICGVAASHVGGKQTDGLGHLSKLSFLLRCIAKEHFVAVLVTNNVIKVDNSMYKPALGKYWLHVPDVRILFERMTKNNDNKDSRTERKITLLKSNRKACGLSMTVEVCTNGFIGVPSDQVML